MEKLLDANWVWTAILLPAVDELFDRDGCTRHEHAILVASIHEGTIQNGELRPLLGGLSQVQVSRTLAGLRSRDLLVPVQGKARSDHIGVSKSPLLRTVLRQLDKHGFLPVRGEI